MGEREGRQTGAVNSVIDPPESSVHGVHGTPDIVLVPGVIPLVEDRGAGVELVALAGCFLEGGLVDV